MPSVIFARPRHEYGSYKDYFKLVELSGYPIIYKDEIDSDSDNTYILSTPDTYWHDGTERHGWPGAKARIIYYSLEWYTDVDYASIPGLAETWSPDKWFAERHGMRYVPMGGHEGLKLHPTPQNGKVYDAATLFAPCYRRYYAMGQFKNEGVTVAPNGWDEERHRILMQSYCMVQVHQHDNLPVVAPQRWVLAAAYELPMITETLGDCGIFGQSYRLMSDLDHMGEFVRMWTRDGNEQRLADFGFALHGLLCRDYTFRKAIESHV
jgi:hypothetical protein